MIPTEAQKQSLKMKREQASGPSLRDAGSAALRYADRAARVAGLGVGTAGAIATAPLQVIPGVTDWLPEVDETLNAWRAFNEFRQKGDWDAGISAAQDAFDAGPGYWGLSEIAGAMIPTGGPALAGARLAAVAPRLGRAAPAARGVGKALRAPWEAEEFVGRQVVRPLAAGFRGIRGTGAATEAVEETAETIGRVVPEGGEQLPLWDRQLQLFDTTAPSFGIERPTSKLFSGDVRRGLGVERAGSVAALNRTSQWVNIVGSFLDATGTRGLDRRNWFAPRNLEITGEVETAFRDAKNIQIEVASHANRMRVWAEKNKKVFNLNENDQILDESLQGIVREPESANVLVPTIQDVAARYDRYRPHLTDAQARFMEELRALMEEGRVWESGVEMPGWNQVLRESIPGWDISQVRPDVTGRGFYITRGRGKGGVFGNDEFDEALHVMNAKGKKPRRKTTAESKAEQASMGGAIARGVKYRSFEEALQHHILQTGDRITGGIAANEGTIAKRVKALAERTTATAGRTKVDDVRGMSDYMRTDIPINDELGRAFQREYNRLNPSNPLSAQKFNQLYRSMKATGDLSHVGIQGLLAAYRNFPAWSRASLYAIKSLKRGTAVEADFIDSFDNFANTNGLINSETWASFGLRIGGVESEYQIPLAGRLAEGSMPGLRQIGQVFERANISFGTFGDTLRLGWAQSILKAEMRGRNLDELLRSGDMERIADIANKMTGWSDTSFASTTFGADLGNALLFAPRYFQSRLDTLGQAMLGTARTVGRGEQTIQSREASRAVWSMIGMGTVMTLAANEALGIETDMRPLVDGRYNPNFMRIRMGGQDISLFGTWDSLLRMTILSAGGVKDPSKIADAYRGMSSGAVRVVWDNVTGYTFTGEDAPITQTEAGRHAASPQDIATYVGQLMLPISFIQAGDPLRQTATSIPGAIRGDEGARGALAGGVMGTVGEMTGVRLTPLSRTDRKEQLALEKYGKSFTDLDNITKDLIVVEVAEKYGAQVYTGPNGDLYRTRDTIKTTHQDNVAAAVEQNLSGSYGTANYNPYEARKIIRKSQQTMREDLDRIYARMFPGQEQEEPELNTPEHLVWQYYQLFEVSKDAKGELDYEALDEAEAQFWGRLSPEQTETVLNNIRVTEGRYPEQAQQMRAATRYINNYKLNIGGQTLSYWDLDRHKAVATAMSRELPTIPLAKIQQYLDASYGEKRGLYLGSEGGLFEEIDKAHGKLYREGELLWALRKTFLDRSDNAFRMTMSLWDYKYQDDKWVRQVLRKMGREGQPLPEYDYEALYRSTLGVQGNG